MRIFCSDGQWAGLSVTSGGTMMKGRAPGWLDKTTGKEGTEISTGFWCASARTAYSSSSSVPCCVTHHGQWHVRDAVIGNSRGGFDLSSTANRVADVSNNRHFTWRLLKTDRRQRCYQNFISSRCVWVCVYNICRKYFSRFKGGKYHAIAELQNYSSILNNFGDR